MISVVASRLTLSKPAYSELVPSPEIGRVAAGMASGIKTPWVHGWGYSLCHLYVCCRPASGHTVRCVSERGPAVNQASHQIQNLASTEEVWVVALDFSCLFQLYPQGSA